MKLSELYEQYTGMKYQDVVNLAENGDSDAQGWINFDRKFRKIIASNEAQAIAEYKGYPVKKGDPKIPYWYKFISRKRVFDPNRWYAAVDRDYGTFRHEYLLRMESYGTPKPEGYYMDSYYRVITPTAYYLALCEFDKEPKRRYKVGDNLTEGFVTAIRTEIERYLFDGFTTDTDEYERLETNPQYIDDPSDLTEGDYDASLPLRFSTANMAKYLQKVAEEIETVKKQEIKPSYQSYATAGGQGLYEVQELEEEKRKKDYVRKMLKPFTIRERILIMAEYGELQELAKKWGIKANTLAQRRKRLLDKLREQYKDVNNPLS